MKQCVVDAHHRLGGPAFRKQGADIVRCRDCGCIMADVDFQHEQYESDHYYTLARKSVAEIDEEWGLRWRFILRRLARQVGQETAPLSLLDVGAGNGYFVALAAREFGWRAVGLEISERETRFAHEMLGVGLLREDIAGHRGNYDVVTCFNVIEHVPAPRDFLAAVAARVKPGGMLALSTPNPGCIHARVRGLRRWNMVDPPHHLNLFSRQALRAMLAAERLQVLHYDTLSTYINFVRRFDTRGVLLRRLVFQLLRAGRLGADHFLMAKKMRN